VDAESNDNQMCSTDRIEPTLSQRARKDGAPTVWLGIDGAPGREHGTEKEECKEQVGQVGDLAGGLGERSRLAQRFGAGGFCTHPFARPVRGLIG
jgi:hypothetical protein